jgi:hypothetical protein
MLRRWRGMLWRHYRRRRSHNWRRCTGRWRNRRRRYWSADRLRSPFFGPVIVWDLGPGRFRDLLLIGILSVLEPLPLIL